MSKVTWNDLKNATPSELKKTYKLNDRQLENQVRKHMDGANHAERRGLYETVWAKHRLVRERGRGIRKIREWACIRLGSRQGPG